MCRLRGCEANRLSQRRVVADTIAYVLALRKGTRSEEELWNRMENLLVANQEVIDESKDSMWAPFLPKADHKCV